MSLEDIKKLCDEATPGPWPLYHEVVPNEYGAGNPVLPPSDCKFIAAARDWMPKLITVADAAKNLPYGCWSGELEEALNALEKK